MTRRRSAPSSSRIFPGHECALNAASTSGQSWTSRRYRRLKCSRKKDAKTGISSLRCLSGGTKISTTLRARSSCQRSYELPGSSPSTAAAMTAPIEPEDRAAAGARERPRPKHVNEPGNRGARQGPDLVQVDCALVRELEASEPPPGRQGRGAPLVAE